MWGVMDPQFAVWTISRLISGREWFSTGISGGQEYKERKQKEDGTRKGVELEER
jgi:hypothetical protein